MVFDRGNFLTKELRSCNKKTIVKLSLTFHVASHILPVRNIYIYCLGFELFSDFLEV